MACVGLAVSLPLMAGPLSFVKPDVTIEPPLDNQTVTVSLPFTNVSAAAAIIREIRTECDCVQTSSMPATVGAGQIGAILLSFRARVRNGAEVVRAEVITGSGEAYAISVTANLRSNIEVTPQTLLWESGQPRETLEFVVSPTGRGKLRFTKVVAVKEARVEMLPGKDPSCIRVLVTPPLGDKRFQDVVLVTATMEETGETKVYDLHVRGE